MRKDLLVTGLIVAALSPVCAHAALIACGNVTDPPGDSLNTSPDMVSGSVCIDSGGNAQMTVTYAGGTSLTDASPTFVLDTDKNPATGFPGVDAANNDSALIGQDYAVEIFGSSFQANAQVLKWNGSSFSFVSNVSVTYSGTTETATVPLSDLGGIDGSMNFVVDSQQQLTTNSFTGIGDYMPNLGAVGTVTVSEPATIALLGLAFAGIRMARRRALS